MNCSLVVSTYNWPQALELCLLSIKSQRLLPSEVVIADDGSRGDTVELIGAYQELFPCPLKHIWHEDLGFRKTIILNKAVRNCDFEYIIQIDGDVILDKHFVADHLDVAEPGAFIRGTRAMLTEEKTKEILASKNIDLSLFSSGVKHKLNAFRSPILKFAGVRKEWSSSSVRGSNLAFWKADFEKVNGYNNQLLGWGHEDEELAARFINNRIVKKIVKLRAVQYHLYHPTKSQENERNHRMEVEEVKKGKLIVCSNGYNNV